SGKILEKKGDHADRPLANTVRTVLEVDLRTQLHQPAGGSGGNVSEVGRLNVAARVIELRVVEDVERFQSPLKGRTVGNLRVIQDGKGRGDDAGGMQGVPTGVAKRACRSDGKACGIKPEVLHVVEGRARAARIQGLDRGGNLVGIVATAIEAEGITAKG